jgi:endonuclease YncB( thermonuclease family)
MGVLVLGSARFVAAAEGLTAGGTDKVVEVVDGDTVKLSSGDQVRLVGLQAPKLPLGRPDFEKWPLADEAKAALSGLVLGRTVTLSYGGRRIDRYRRLLAHLHLPDGRWVQGEMLRLGLARVYTFADNRALAGRMYALEAAARAARRGIWANAYYAVRTDTEAARHADSFQLVEGTVYQAARTRRLIYLNFERNWRRDFTVEIDKRAERLFRAAGIDPLAYEGKRIRVRGWVKLRNGPAIRVTHPEQIEPLDPAARP